MPKEMEDGVILMVKMKTLEVREMTDEVPEMVNRQDRLENLVNDDYKTLRVEPDDEKTIGRSWKDPVSCMKIKAGEDDENN